MVKWIHPIKWDLFAIRKRNVTKDYIQHINLSFLCIYDGYNRKKHMKFIIINSFQKRKKCLASATGSRMYTIKLLCSFETTSRGWLYQLNTKKDTFLYIYLNSLNQNLWRIEGNYMKFRCCFFIFIISYRVSTCVTGNSNLWE